MSKQPSSSFICKQVRSGKYYFLKRDPHFKSDVTIVCGGREVCDSSYQIDRNDFQYQCLEYVAKGTGTLQINGQQFPLREGVLFYYGPGVAHSIRVDKGSTMVKYFVDFTGSNRDLLKDIPLSQFKPIQTAESTSILEIYELLHRAAKPQRNHSVQICALLLEMLILRAKELAVPQVAIDSPSWSSYQICCKYIESNFLKLRELSEVATACGVSKEYLCRLFNKYHTCSAYQFLTQLKMAHAASLLVRPGHLVKEAAAAVGFEDAYHFSKAFKRVNKVSPEQFRKRQPL